MYAAGKIPGGFIKREGRPTEHSILAARLVDRPIRPLFPKGYRNDVQVVITVLSADMENDSDVLGIIARLRRALDLQIFRSPGRLAACASAISTARSSSTRPRQN